jgi:hypothetical protein
MPSRFKLLSRADLDSLPDAKWLIPGLLAAESFAVLYGPPGSAKTFLALELALSIASGIEGSACLGKPVESGAVIYVAGEGVRGIRKRIEAWERHHGCEPIAGIRLLEVAPNLMAVSEANEIIAAARELNEPIRLTVIDTMARCMPGGDENSSKDVGEFVRNIDRIRRELGCAVLDVHHSGKNDPKTERGSSALRGAADTMISLADKSGVLTLTCEKQKDADSFAGRRLQLKTVPLDDDGQSSCVLVPGDSDGDACATSAAATRHARVIGEILTAAGRELTHKELREAFQQKTGKSAATFNRAIDEPFASLYFEKTASGAYCGLVSLSGSVKEVS